MFFVIKNNKIAFGDFKESFSYYLKGKNLDPINVNKKKRFIFNATFFKVVFIIINFIATDFILITFHIITQYLGHNLSVLTVLWTIILLLVLNLLKSAHKLKYISNEIFSRMENDIKLNILKGKYIHYFSNSNIMVNYYFKNLECGLTPFISIILYPLRLFLLVNIVCGSYYVCIITSIKLIILLIISLIFQITNYILFIIPEQESISEKLEEFFENIQSISILKNHKELYLNMFDDKFSFSYFSKNCFKNFLSLLQFLCLFYFIFGIIIDIQDNLGLITQDSDKNINCFVLFLSLSLYLIDSINTVKLIASYIISYKNARKAYENKYKRQILVDFIQDSENNISDNLNLELKSLKDCNEGSNYISIVIGKSIETSPLEQSHLNNICPNVAQCKNMLAFDNVKHENNKFKTYITTPEPYEKEYSFNAMKTDNNSPISTSFSSPEKMDKQNIIEINNTSIFCLNLNERNFFVPTYKFLSNKFVYWFNSSLGGMNFKNNIWKHQENINCKNQYNNSNYIGNINLSVTENDFLIILGPNNCGKTLLTKYLSGFPEIFSNGNFQIRENYINSKIYLLNKRMLDLVSNFCENKLRPEVDLLGFILSGKKLNKNIFDFLFELLSFGDYYRYELSKTGGIKHTQNEKLENVIKLYPIIETQQGCNEAKICLQLFQFFYSILCSHKSVKNSTIIIDDVFDLLLPSTSLRIIDNIVSKDSLSIFSNFSFIITVNERLEPFFSQILSRENSKLKLMSLDGNGISNIHNHFDKNQAIEKSIYMMNSIPPINFDINDINSRQEIDTSIYYFKDSPFSSNEINIEQIESKKNAKRKYEIFVLILGILSFFMKLCVFSNLNGFQNDSDLYIFTILIFTSLVSQLHTNKNFNMNELSNIIFGFFVISTFLFVKNDILNREQLSNGSTSNSDNIGESKRLIPNIHYNSTFFLEFGGSQLLKNTSKFYKENYINERIYIPGINTKGFKDAIFVSELIEKKVASIHGINRTVTPFKNEKGLTSSIPNHIVLDLIKILIFYYFIDMILKTVLHLFISSIKNENSLSKIKNRLLNLFLYIESTKDPISATNNIYMRRNTFADKIFNELFHSKEVLFEHYFSITISINLLLVLNLANLYTGSIFLKATTILFIIFTLSTMCKLVGYFVSDSRDPPKILSGINFYSFDLLHYLKTTEIIEWFGSLVTKSINCRYEFQKFRNSYIVKFYIYSILPIFLISLATIIANNRGSSYEFNSNLSLLTSVLLLFFRSTLSHELLDSSKKYIVHLKGLQRKISNYFDKNHYSLIKINLSSLTPSSSRTNKSNTSNSSRTDNLCNIAIEFSSPFLTKLQESDFDSQYNVTKETNGIDILMVNPLNFVENSYSYGFGCSPLSPFRYEIIKVGTKLDKVGIISNYNLVPLKWNVRMILDPNKIFKNESNSIRKVLESFELIPKDCENAEIEGILNHSLENYCNLTKEISETKQEFVSEFKLRLNKESKILGNFGNYNFFTSNNISNIQKILLLAHFILYCQYYHTLVVHLNYNMNVEPWISFIKGHIVYCKNSSIKNIILIYIDDDYLKNNFEALLMKSNCERLNKIRQQVEFYLSDSNIRHDKFLRSKLAEFNNGSNIGVPISLILTFNKMVKLNASDQDIINSLSSSKSLFINFETKTIHRFRPIDLDFCSIIPCERMLFIKGIPRHWNHKNIKELLQVFGNVQVVRLPKANKSNSRSIKRKIIPKITHDSLIQTLWFCRNGNNPTSEKCNKKLQKLLSKLKDEHFALVRMDIN
ncbi:integral membrane protein [Cryptosporidium ryanae]|uniref:uncharacterized protein n=1 Tax=Cryptosporidium ryanae TaxID=515981 RepID=UPI00351A69FD|nr:integral membrane protein [Cryptosporidium ryanae]